MRASFQSSTFYFLLSRHRYSPVVVTPNRTERGKWIFGGLALFALWFVLCRQLSGEWSGNEQYSYGWFVPFFAAFLFWLRWEERPRLDEANVHRPTSVTPVICVFGGMLA